MRQPTVIKGLKNSQKIRAIVDGVAIYMTVGQVATVFGTTKHQVAVKNTLQLMVLEGCGGMGHTVKVYDERCQAATVQVQVDLM
jgi:hypothetical protein